MENVNYSDEKNTNLELDGCSGVVEIYSSSRCTKLEKTTGETGLQEKIGSLALDTVIWMPIKYLNRDPFYL